MISPFSSLADHQYEHELMRRDKYDKDMDGIKTVPYDSLSDRPSASTFGVGQCQIGRAVYVSDGASWTTGLSITEIASSALATTTGQSGIVYELSDGIDAGAKLTWSIPSGASTPTWCWWLWPQSSYGV